MRHLPAAFLALLYAGCAAPAFDAQGMVREWGSYMQQDHVLVPGDVLAISCFQVPELTQEVVVSPSGSVTLLRLPNSLKAIGRKVSEFRKLVEEAYTQIQPGAEISVNLKTANERSVYVAGEVQDPGAIPWVSNMSVARSIAAAGGFLITVKSSDVLLVRPDPVDQKPRSIRVDVNAILAGESPDFLLLPGDIVWCQTSFIADMGNFVELYIRRLLPFSITGVSVGGGN